MADIEIHEHVVVNGPTAKLRNSLVHHNFDCLSRYILKHDEYSNWESRVLQRSELPRTKSRQIYLVLKRSAAAGSSESSIVCLVLRSCSFCIVTLYVWDFSMACPV